MPPKMYNNVCKLKVYRLIFSYRTGVIGKSAVFAKSMYVQMNKCTQMYRDSLLTMIITSESSAGCTV